MSSLDADVSLDVVTEEVVESTVYSFCCSKDQQTLSERNVTVSMDIENHPNISWDCKVTVGAWKRVLVNIVNNSLNGGWCTSSPVRTLRYLERSVNSLLSHCQCPTRRQRLSALSHCVCQFLRVELHVLLKPHRAHSLHGFIGALCVLQVLATTSHRQLCVKAPAS